MRFTLLERHLIAQHAESEGLAFGAAARELLLEGLIARLAADPEPGSIGAQLAAMRPRSRSPDPPPS